MKLLPLTVPSVLLTLAVGIITGIFSGIFGVGGGVVLVPMLILLFKYAPQAASGSSLCSCPSECWE